MNIDKINSPGSEAVMYLRVSTPEQADPLNLKNQEDGCRRLANQRGIAVAEVILGPGESGRTADRPSFVRLLSYCKAKPQENRLCYRRVVEPLCSQCRRSGCCPCRAAGERHNSALCGGTKCYNTAAGRMAAGVHGSLNQYLSDPLY